MNRNEKTTKGILSTALLLCLALCMLFTGCAAPGETGGVPIPQGMKDATGEGVGYYLFLPDDWKVDHSTGVTIATYATARMIFSSFNSKREPAEYWNASREETEKMFTEFHMDEDAAKTLLGKNAALRYKFSGISYDGDGDGEKDKYGVTQYVSKRNGKMYVLTYMAPFEKDYEQYTAVVETVVANFLFTEEEATGTPASPTDTDSTVNGGVKDIADPAIHDFHLYVPASWVTDLQNGTVSAYVSEENRTSISLVRNYPTAANTLPEYFEKLEKEYREQLSDYQLVKKEERRKASTAEIDSLRYEFTATKGGTSYRFMQELFVKGSYVYTFTYTASEERYAHHLDEADAIIAGIAFD